MFFTGGNKLSVLVMSATVGGLLILVVLQGSFFVSEGTNEPSGKVTVDHLKGKRAWDAQREKALEKLQKSDITTTSSSTTATQNLCSYLPRRTTTKKLWTNFIGAVLAYSQHPDDPTFFHEDWTKRLLSQLPPAALANTLHSAPPQHHIERILDIIQQKLQHPDTSPPLRIAVVGGAFAEGEGCDIASVAVPEGSIMANPSFCAWPYRFQGFLNALMGGIKWVEVTNLSEEGTDTGFITPLV